MNEDKINIETNNKHEFAVTENPKLEIFLYVPPKYLCPIHGEIEDTITFTMPKYFEGMVVFCCLCWYDWMLKNIPIVEKIGEKKG